MRHSFIDEHSSINSFLNNIHPRIKIIVFLAFIIFINLTKNDSLLPFFLYGLILAILILLSKVPLSFIFKRSLNILPFVLISVIFLPFRLWQIIIIKAYLSIICVVLLTSSTAFVNLLKSALDLRCPKLIIAIISFMYRYIFLIEDELMKTQQAKNSRLTKSSNLTNLKTNSSILGALFLRSYERAESVYLAMQARGFNGSINTLNTLYMQKKDLAFLFVIISLLVSIKFLA